MSSQLRTLTFGDRRISYDEASSQQENLDTEEKDYSSIGAYQFSDLDSGVCEDVCCDDVRSTPETERKIIKPDVSTIRELTNFDEDDEEEEGRESDEDTEGTEDDGEEDDVEEAEDVGVLKVNFSALSPVSDRDDICLTGFEYHSLGPASLSVLQLNRSELVHMRHVMVKIELDSREQEVVVGRVEAGRVCVVCTRTQFSLWSGAGLECTVCKYTVCTLCTAASPTTPSLPSSPSSPSSPLSPSSPSASITDRLGSLFSARRRSLDSRPAVLCRPCSQFVEQMNIMTEEDDFANVDSQRSM